MTHHSVDGASGLPSYMRVEPAEAPSKRAYTGYVIPPGMEDPLTWLAEWDVSTSMGEVSEVLPCRVGGCRFNPGYSVLPADEAALPW